MTISEAHRKLGHVSYGATKHVVSKGFITGITIDPDSKPDFCEVCTKAKSVHQPFPQESNTRAKKYKEQVHWDLWGPAFMKSLSGNSYVAACIDNATHDSKLHFQQKKSQLFQSYKKDKAYIKTQSGNHIKVSRSDKGESFSQKPSSTTRTKEKQYANSLSMIRHLKMVSPKEDENASRKSLSSSPHIRPTPFSMGRSDKSLQLVTNLNTSLSYKWKNSIQNENKRQLNLAGI
jgi:GAG-pre-integrase domain